MNTPVRTLLAYLHRLIEYAAFYGVLFTLAGLFDRHHWFLGLFTHLKLPLAGCFIGYTLIELAARHRHHAAVGAIFALVNALPLLPCLPAPQQVSIHTRHAVCQLRILQANILTSNRDAAALLSLIDREAPDVIVLQETGRRWLSDLAVLTNAYPVFAAMPREDNFGVAIFCKTNAYTADSRLMTGECEDHAFLVKRRAESRERGRPRPQQRVVQKGVTRASCPCSMVSFFDMIDMIDMTWRASVPTSRRGEQWRAGVPTSRLPLCGRMVSGFIAEHREGRASARPRASRRLPLPAAVTPPPRKRSLRLRVSALKKLSTLNFLRAGTPARPTVYTQNTRSTRMPPCHQPIKREDGL